ncbi:hypothetical protein T01_1402 [Trichinella spiralis]|uniref:Uncharacterized protein n=1 Tax=Trichinella spiralis TaxID=6334 RepID=A0A0V1BGL7_TRISP|nr:hypothetical protein T01_1402 [Trichinella spiralis]
MKSPQHSLTSNRHKLESFKRKRTQSYTSGGRSIKQSQKKKEEEERFLIFTAQVCKEENRENQEATVQFFNVGHIPEEIGCFPHRYSSADNVEQPLSSALIFLSYGAITARQAVQTEAALISYCFFQLYPPYLLITFRLKIETH